MTASVAGLTTGAVAASLISHLAAKIHPYGDRTKSSVRLLASVMWRRGGYWTATEARSLLLHTPQSPTVPLLPSWLDLSLSCIAYWALAMVSTVIGRWRGVVLVDFDVPVESVNAVRYKLKIFTHPRETLDRSLSLESQIPRGNLPLGPIPVIEDLRRLLVEYYPLAKDNYLFPGRSNGHISHDSAARILKTACQQVDIFGVSTHSFRRTALTSMSNAGIPLRVI